VSAGAGECLPCRIVGVMAGPPTRSAVVRALALLVGAVLAVQVLRVHSEGGEWRLTPSAAPPKIAVDGHEYLRSDQADPPGVQVHELPDGFVEHGTTPGGGTIYEPSSGRGDPATVYVRDGQRIVAYELVGGP
jgi:hypothetical protein